MTKVADISEVRHSPESVAAFLGLVVKLIGRIETALPKPLQEPTHRMVKFHLDVVQDELAENLPPYDELSARERQSLRRLLAELDVLLDLQRRYG